MSRTTSQGRISARIRLVGGCAQDLGIWCSIGRHADDVIVAAKAALKRKKMHEHTLEQTTAQISTLEQQIYSIEAANINAETLKAMEQAGQAMAQIHGKLNIDKVDETMYVARAYCYMILSLTGM